MVRGLYVRYMGILIGYYFENNRTSEYKIIGGEKELELKSKDIGKYYTNENFIFINEIKIDRKNLKYQRFFSLLEVIVKHLKILNLLRKILILSYLPKKIKFKSYQS